MALKSSWSTLRKRKQHVSQISVAVNHHERLNKCTLRFVNTPRLWTLKGMDHLSSKKVKGMKYHHSHGEIGAPPGGVCPEKWCVEVPKTLPQEAAFSRVGKSPSWRKTCLTLADEI
ncbi:uncharacterized protein LOC106999399 [Macaca mulatta]